MINSKPKSFSWWPFWKLDYDNHVSPASGNSAFKLTDEAEHKPVPPPPCCISDTAILNTAGSWWEEKLREGTTAVTLTAV